MREVRPSGSEGGVAPTRHPHPYRTAALHRSAELQLYALLTTRLPVPLNARFTKRRFDAVIAVSGWVVALFHEQQVVMFSSKDGLPFAHPGPSSPGVTAGRSGSLRPEPSGACFAAGVMPEVSALESLQVRVYPDRAAGGDCHYRPSCGIAVARAGQRQGTGAPRCLQE